MDTSIERFGEVSLLQIRGRLDQATAGRLADSLAALVTDSAARGGAIVLDFSGVDYISSMGLRSLMLARKQADAGSVDVVITSLSEPVREVFAISRFDTLFRLFDEPLAALAALSSDAAEAYRKEQPVAASAEAAEPGGLGVRFWGTRGSLPTALDSAAFHERIMEVSRRVRATPGESVESLVNALPFHLRGTYGGETSCVEIESAHPEYAVCDMGSGARRLALDCLAKHGPGAPQVYNVFQSHVHWDHIMGFPFFVPAYIPGNIVRIHGCHAELEAAYRGQQSSPCFPVHFDALASTTEFVTLEPDRRYDIGGLTVTPFRQVHSDDSYGYRFERNGYTVVYSTDSEHKLDDHAHLDYIVSNFKDANIVVFDSMYSLADATSLKEDWGHSSNMVAVELCHQANVQELCLFHHEPIYSDAQIDTVLEETRRYEEIARGDARALTVTASYDGLRIAVNAVKAS